MTFNGRQTEKRLDVAGALLLKAQASDFPEETASFAKGAYEQLAEFLRKRPADRTGERTAPLVILSPRRRQLESGAAAGATSQQLGANAGSSGADDVPVIDLRDAAAAYRSTAYGAQTPRSGGAIDLTM